ncbi:MAG: cache domain-containing protein [Candidatus Omnitrophica bacterium]|nr:cache domain-containing protein [Candidatus Omnitrophota bacterium]
MKKITLKNTIFLSFIIVIMIFCLFVSALGAYFIKINIMDSRQSQVTDALEAASSVLEEKIDEIEFALQLGLPTDDYEKIKEKANLDYIYDIPISDIEQADSFIAKKAVTEKEVSGIRVITHNELRNLDEHLVSKVDVDIKYTPKTQPSSLKVLRDAIVAESAVAITDKTGNVTRVVCAGNIINRDYDLVDKIRDLVFEEKTYNGVPVGTVTIFQDDVRIATNVLDENGNRAIGTRVSKIVYDNVVLEGKTWLDRAFVVTDWYITAYKPIKDINGKIIGILYVGILERPFIDMAKNTLLAFFAIVIIMGLIAIIISVLLSSMIAKPVTEMLAAIKRISSGQLKSTVKSKRSIKELDQLSDSFNEMANKLDESYEKLQRSKEGIELLNKNYLDLISFVSHELKGILASTILNAYSVRDGFLGMVNFKQQKALDSITRNLDYLDSTVKNFLDLSRIEKNEITVNKRTIKLKEDVVDVSLDNFAKQITEKNITVENLISGDLEMNADKDLTLVVVNNLISNAIKYGEINGKIIIKASKVADDRTQASIYNDSQPLTEEEGKIIFEKFRRLNTAKTKNVKGTGLGLFITKEIVTSQGGEIFMKPSANGNEFIFTI